MVCKMKECTWSMYVEGHSWTQKRKKKLWGSTLVFLQTWIPYPMLQRTISGSNRWPCDLCSFGLSLTLITVARSTNWANHPTVDGDVLCNYLNKIIWNALFSWESLLGGEVILHHFPCLWRGGERFLRRISPIPTSSHEGNNARTEAKDESTKTMVLKWMPEIW